jgi:limonene-1,2-epoxide hydrolase
MAVTDSETVVRNFLKAWEARDLDTIMEYFDDGAVYENVPVPPVTGRADIRNFIGGILYAFKNIEVVIHHQVSDGGIVMNERTDTIRAESGTEVPLRVMGIFEIRDGRIVKWRDYFDGAALKEVFDP